MVINFKLKALLTLVLLINFSSFAKENSGHAPEATAAETKSSFRDLAYLKEAFINTAPADRNDGLIVGKLGVDGGNEAMVLQLAQELADNKQGDYDSLLIAHKGTFLFESYYKRGRINLPHFQSSATKSYLSLALGRAIQLGYLTMADLDKPLVSFLKGLDHTKFVDGVEKITLHQAMTMRSGLRFSKEQMTTFRTDPEQFNGLAQIQAFLELSEPVTHKSQTYKYQGPDPIMVMQVLDTVVPGSAKAFIKNEFFKKLAITNYKWSDDKNGLLIGDTGSSLTSRDMLKLGVLVTSGGQWKGEQLLSADYLAKATSGITRATEDWQEPESFFYGYLWYQTDVIVGNKSYGVKIAWGGGGNRVISVEALDLVIVLTGLDWDDKIFAQVSEKILPAFVK
jgi:CubicO group peptidase (beta-lactamase class C family)